MRLPTANTLVRLMAFTDEKPEDYAALALDARAAAWMLYDHLMPEAPEDKFRFELRERWESMYPARRAQLRGKGVPWLRGLYLMAAAKSAA